MFTKEQIESEIAELEEALKTASPMEYGRLEASRRIWLGRLVTWKAGGYRTEEPEADESELKTKTRRKRK